MRLPAKYGTYPIGACYQGRRVTRTTWFFPNIEFFTIDLLNHIQHFTHTVTVSIATIQCNGFITLAQIVECFYMGVCQVLNMDVIPYSSSIQSRVVSTEYRYMLAFAYGSFTGNLD